MSNRQNKPPLIVICGPTASGKTALSVALAKKLGTEIISADSMQVYRGMDIGTAKPTQAERQGVPHHLIDCVEPNESFDLARYVALAQQAIHAVQQRGNIPILCGGTGLYITTLTEGIRLGESGRDDAYRAELAAFAQEHGNHALHEKLAQIDPESYDAIHENNVGRVIRALEVHHTTGSTISRQKAESRGEEPYRTGMIGLAWSDRTLLYRRIDSRVDEMMREGLLGEVEKLAQMGYNRDWTSLQAIGYKELLDHLEGRCSLEEAVERIKRESRRYAKRQLTWLRRDRRIRWVELTEQTTAQQLLQQALTILEEQRII